MCAIARSATPFNFIFACMYHRTASGVFDANHLTRSLNEEFVAPATLSAELEHICDTTVTEFIISIQNAARELRDIDVVVKATTTELGP